MTSLSDKFDKTIRSNIVLEKPTFYVAEENHDITNKFSEVLDFIDNFDNVGNAYNQIIKAMISSRIFSHFDEQKAGNMINLTVNIAGKAPLIQRVYLGDEIMVQQLDFSTAQFNTIAEKMSVWCKELFIYAFSDDYQEKLTEFVNGYFGQNFVLNSSSQETVNNATPYKHDEVYKFLRELTGNDTNSGFILDKVGMLVQNDNRNQWQLVGENITFALDDRETCAHSIATVAARDSRVAFKNYLDVFKGKESIAHINRYIYDNVYFLAKWINNDDSFDYESDSEFIDGIPINNTNLILYQEQDFSGWVLKNTENNQSLAIPVHGVEEFKSYLLDYINETTYQKLFSELNNIEISQDFELDDNYHVIPDDVGTIEANQEDFLVNENAPMINHPNDVQDMIDMISDGGAYRDEDYDSDDDFVHYFPSEDFLEQPPDYEPIPMEYITEAYDSGRYSMDNEDYQDIGYYGETDEFIPPMPSDFPENIVPDTFNMPLVESIRDDEMVYSDSIVPVDIEPPYTEQSYIDNQSIDVYNNEPDSINELNENSTRLTDEEQLIMWKDLDNLEISTHDFFVGIKQLDLPLSPQKVNDNHFVFINKENGERINISLDGDLIVYNGEAVSLGEFYPKFLKENGVSESDINSYRTDFVGLIHDNWSNIQSALQKNEFEDKSLGNETNGQVDDNHIEANEPKPINIMERISSISNLYSIAELFDIALQEKLIVPDEIVLYRGKNSYIFDGKRYRISDNRWFCQDDIGTPVYSDLALLLDRIIKNNDDKLKIIEYFYQKGNLEKSVVHAHNDIQQNNLNENIHEDSLGVPENITKNLLEPKVESVAVVSQQANNIKIDSQPHITKAEENIHSQKSVSTNSLTNTNSLSGANTELVKDTKEIFIEQQNNVVTEEVTLDNFNLLVEAKKAELLSKKSLLNNFALTSFLEIAKENRIYRVAKDENGNYLIGNDAVLINIKDYKNTTDFIRQMCDKFSIDVNKELERVTNKMQPIFHQKIEALIRKEIEKNTISLQQKNDLVNHKVNNVQNTEQVSPQQEVIERQIGIERSENAIEQLENDLFQTPKSLDVPIKKYLYEYELKSFGKYRVNANIKTILNNLIYSHNNYYHTQIPNPEYQNIGTSAYEVQISFGDNIIRCVSEKNKEYWEIVSGAPLDKNGVSVTSGDSLVECIQSVILPRLGVKFNRKGFHIAIGNALEDNFLRFYPKRELLLAYSEPNNGGSNYKIGDMEWSEHVQSGTIKFWNANTTDSFANCFTIAKFIALQIERVPNWKTYISKDNKFTDKDLNNRINKKAKEIIFNHYAGLNSLQRNSLLSNENNIVQEESTETIIEKEREFNTLLPIMKQKDTQLAKDYLIEHRFLNPRMIDESMGKLWYGGMYDHKKLSRSGKYTPKPDDLLPVVVFPNDSKTFAAVRGVTKSADHIKENIPGSRDAGDPYCIPPSNDYVYLDGSKPDDNPIKIVFCESAIDAWSYHSLYPKDVVYAMCGTSTVYLERCLMDFYDMVKEKYISNTTICYAMDNTGLREDGVALDSASRHKYFTLYEKMGRFCYSNFFADNQSSIDECNEENCIEHTLSLLESLNRFSEQQMDFARKTLEESAEKNVMSYHQSKYRDVVGKLLYQFYYIDTGIFKEDSPDNYMDKLGYQVKDWNAYLEGMVKKYQADYPDKDLQEIHDMITFSHSPELGLTEKMTKQLSNKLVSPTLSI